MLQVQLGSMAKISSLFVCFVLIYANENSSDAVGTSTAKMYSELDKSVYLMLVLVGQHGRFIVRAGRPATMSCQIIGSDGQLWWTRNGKNLTFNENNSRSSSMFYIYKLVQSDSGGYTCWARTTRGTLLKDTLHITVMDHPEIFADQNTLRVKLNESATISCHVRGSWEGGWLSAPSWDHELNGRVEGGKYTTNISHLNETWAIMTLHFASIEPKDAGIYTCSAGSIDIHIEDKMTIVITVVPQVFIEYVKVVDIHKLYFNWTIKDGNDQLISYTFMRLKNGTKKWNVTKYPCWNGNCPNHEKIYVDSGAAYRVGVIVSNSIGDSEASYSKWITTWEKAPEFHPTIWVESTTLDSIAIGWSPVSPELQEYVRDFEISAIDHRRNLNSARVGIESRKYVFVGLNPETNYSIRVAACNSFTGDCSRWMGEKQIMTIDRDPKFVPMISIEATSLHSIAMRWPAPPPELRDKVHQYKVMATHLSKEIGPIFLNGTANSYVFEDLKSLTSYFLKVAACGEFSTQCGNWSAAKEVLTIDGEEKGVSTIWWSVIVVVVLLVVIVVVWIGIDQRRKKIARRKFIEETLNRYNNEVSDCLSPELNMGEQAVGLPYDKKWEYPRKLLKLDKVIGSGAFGIVRKAAARSISRNEGVTAVAVKMVRATASLNYMTALSRELKILAYLGKHPNIVNLLGACTKNISYGELLVIVEFCRFGNLRDYLLRRRPDFEGQVDTLAENNSADPIFSTDHVNPKDNSVEKGDFDGSSGTRQCSQDSDPSSVVVDDVVPGTDSVQPEVQPAWPSKYEGDFEDQNLNPICTGDLLYWAWQIARGMKYLGSRRVLHGDLAARNVLLADNNIVKICDFGLAKALYTDENYKKSGNDPLPIKWMAIESIKDRVFSVQSDVWSYGIVLWEFFTLAQTPYPGIRSQNVCQKLEDGYRMSQPKYANEDIYHMMLQCWDPEPAKRPSFDKLAYGFADLLDESFKTHYSKLSVSYTQLDSEALVNEKEDNLSLTPSGDAHSSTTEPVLE